MVSLPSFNPLNPELIASPYATYAALRATSPFWSDVMGCWVVLKYDDCIGVLRDAKTYASDWRLAGLDDREQPDESVGLQSLDGAAHGRLRSCFVKAMNGVDRGQQVGSHVRGLVRARLQALPCTDRPFDVIKAVARPVVLESICRAMGLHVPDEASFAHLAEDLVRGMDAGLIPDRAEPARRAKVELNRMMADWANSGGMAEPEGMLRKALVFATKSDIPVGQVLSTARQLFLAGYSTTVAAAANVLLAIGSNRQMALELRENPGLIGATLDELLRLDGPVQGTSRAVTSDALIGEVRVKRGDIVLCLFGAANRDPEVFPDADAVDIARHGKARHLGFGWGPHACTGAIFAREVLQALVGELLDQGLPMVIGDSSRIPRATLRYPDRVMVRIEPC